MGLRATRPEISVFRSFLDFPGVRGFNRATSRKEFLFDPPPGTHRDPRFRGAFFSGSPDWTAYTMRDYGNRIGAWRIGFGVKTIDKQTGHRNDNGVYSLALHADGQLVYQWRMDELDFDESRYINAHIDYSARMRYGAWFHRCFVLPGDRLNNYSGTETLGAVALSKDKPTKIVLKITDAAGNMASMVFWARRDDGAWTIPKGEIAEGEAPLVLPATKAADLATASSQAWPRSISGRATVISPVSTLSAHTSDCSR